MSSCWEKDGKYNQHWTQAWAAAAAAATAAEKDKLQAQKQKKWAEKMGDEEKVERDASEESGGGHKKVRLRVTGRDWRLLNPGFPKPAKGPLNITINFEDNLNK